MSESVFLADLAYKEPNVIYSELVDNYFENFHWISHPDTDTQVLLCTKGSKLFVTFRGTESDNIDDWKTNIDFDFVRLEPWGMVHKGFHDDVMSVKEEIFKYTVKMFVRRPYEVIVGGHSQGAGDGGIFCMMYQGFHEAYLPGMPRVCDMVAADSFGLAHGRKIHRIVHNNDIVTRIPTRFMGYRHFENVHLDYFTEDGNYEIDPSAWERFLDRMHGHFDDIGEWGLDGFKDHDSSIYVKLWEKRDGN